MYNIPTMYVKYGSVPTVMCTPTAGLMESKLSEKTIKEQVATMACRRWPVHFSALFVAFRLSGPRLPKNEVVVAVSGEGFYVMDQPFRVVIQLGYYELVEVFSSRSVIVSLSFQCLQVRHSFTLYLRSMHSLAAVSRPRLSETESEWFVFETS